MFWTKAELEGCPDAYSVDHVFCRGTFNGYGNLRKQSRALLCIYWCSRAPLGAMFNAFSSIYISLALPNSLKNVAPLLNHAQESGTEMGTDS